MPADSGAIFMRFDRQPKLWRDRHGRAHREIEANVPIHSASIERVTGPIEAAFALQSQDFERLLAEGLSRPNPIVTPCGRDALYTWLVEAPSAGSVLLWLADLVEPGRIENAEFSRLGGTGTWALTVKLPRSWRASYRIATNAADPMDSPWRAARGYGRGRAQIVELGSTFFRGHTIHSGRVLAGRRPGGSSGALALRRRARGRVLGRRAPHRRRSRRSRRMHPVRRPASPTQPRRRDLRRLRASMDLRP